MAISIAYIVSAVWAFSALCLLMIASEGQRNVLCVLLFSATFFVNLGYYFQFSAKSLEAALMATKCTYFGGTFLTLLLFLVIWQICGLQLNRFFVIACLLVSTETLVSAFTIGSTSWHYKSVEFVQADGYSYLVKEYGPHHAFYMGVLFFYIFAPIFVVLYTYYKKNQVSWINAILLCSGGVLAFFIYFIERIIGLKIDLVPFTLNVIEIIILVILRRIALYDVSTSAQLSLSQGGNIGFAVLDIKRHYMGADEVAKRYFPELNNLKLDRPIEEPFFLKEFGNWVYESVDKQVTPKYFTRNGDDVKVTVQPLFTRHKNKKQLGYVVTISDDSVNMQYIRQLKAANTKLEELAVEAESANNAKSEFLSLMSHEIRTPINVILGMNDMVLKETDSKTIADYSEDIKGAGQHLLSLINDILDFSKIESGRMELVEAEYDVAGMLDDLKAVADNRIKNKPLNLSFDVSPDIPSKLYGDDRKIKQVVINLLSNAVKYTDMGSVRLFFGVHEIVKNKVVLKIEVQDTGRGIAIENQRWLFEAFSRVDEIKNHGIEGTGIGLYISRSYVEAMGGSISVDSDLGKGSTFTVLLPQIIRNSIPINKSAESIGLMKTTAPNFSNVRILAVDDIKLNLKLLTLFLKDTGATVETCDQPVAAMKLNEKVKYDLIFMDHMMPEMDGVECLEHIRYGANSLNKETPVVIMTANAMQGVCDEYLQKGFNDYISKPFNSEKIMGMITKYAVKENA